MRLLFSVLIIFILNYSLRGQTIETINNAKPKAGIYKTFFEFKYNSPSFKLESIDSIVLSDMYNQWQTYDWNDKVFYKLVLTKERKKELGEIYGFCDGENIYLNSKNTFSKIMYVGKNSLIYSVLLNDVPITNATTTTALINKNYLGAHEVVRPCLLDLNTGIVSQLNKEILSKFIDDKSIVRGIIQGITVPTAALIHIKPLLDSLNTEMYTGDYKIDSIIQMQLYDKSFENYSHRLSLFLQNNPNIYKFNMNDVANIKGYWIKRKDKLESTRIGTWLIYNSKGVIVRRSNYNYNGVLYKSEKLNTNGEVIKVYTN